ncbi:MAG: amino acid adenylation domain-containing protein [Actinomycetota bacterium]|nr:amino acid adenylation domain-containing protein [Actinomycetota bacterium]
MSTATTSTGAGPRAPFDEQATLADLFEAQVARTPDAVAVVDGEEHLTYADLDARANRVARHLSAAGVGPDVPVGIRVERSSHLAVGLLAILKAGGACLPLDPSYPRERLAFMLDDAAPPALLAQQSLVARLPGYGGRLVRLDADLDDIARHHPESPARGAAADDLAYVIYTSGSTGEPKGVMLTHRGLVNHNRAVAALFQLSSRDRVLQFCSISFDVSVEELFPTWATGGTVVLRPDDVPILGDDWLEWLRRERVTVLNLPTAYWQEWVRDLRSRRAEVPDRVRLVVVGGEKALGSAYRTWLEVGGDRVRWLNAYGPAETGPMTTVYEPPGGSWPVDRDPPIGRPIANMSVRILDGGSDPVPVGVPGELHIGGVGLARGYLNRPTLTAERFVPDPQRPDARLYRTGDLVRMLPDGNLEFVGRVDEQVKIRGFRIECREVDSVLGQHPRVADAVVVARQDQPGNRRLVAYVVAAGGQAPTSVELRRFLAERLPPYMVPSAFLCLDALPLTPNGKVDRDALPAPDDPRRGLATTWVAPRTATEEVIAAIWSRALGVDWVGVDDDFFELGGHSLQATQAVAEVRQAFAVEIPVRAIFEAPTVARLAAVVEAQRRGDDLPPPLTRRPRRPGERIPLTLSQEQMWQLETTAVPQGLFNVTAQHWFAGPVDEGALRRALAYVVERHETLRTRFHRESATPHQTVAPSVPVELPVSDLRSVPAGERERALLRRVGEQDAEAFDLARAPLFRAHLYRLGDDRSVVAVTFDHLICDGTSAYIFLSELAAGYEALVARREPAFRPLAVQYPDFARWQREWLTEERLAAQLEYWKKKLAGMPLGPAVSFDRIPDEPTRRIVARPVSVAPGMYDGLQRLARATRSTGFVVTVAAVQALFSRIGRKTDIVLSTTLSGRQRSELEGLIGCFHGVGRIRTDLTGDPAFETVVARARESVLGLFEHQDLPFMRVRRAVLPDFPKGGPELLAAVPTEFQYFHTAHDEWAPGRGVVERPGPDKGPDELFFRGHLHPLNVTFLDDGSQLWGEFSYKVDFYDDATIERLAEGLQRVLSAVIRDPGLRLSELPAAAAGVDR